MEVAIKPKADDAKLIAAVKEVQEAYKRLLEQIEKNKNNAKR